MNPARPVERQVERSFLDINGINHSTYAEAYKASVRSKLIQVIIGVAENENHKAPQVADAIMKEMVVAWG